MCSVGQLGQGVDYLNDIHGFADAALYRELAASACKLIVMHMVQERGVAVRTDVPPGGNLGLRHGLLRRPHRNADSWLPASLRDRIILDPGMGQFVGADPENSLILLRRLPELKARYDLPVLVSVSRKGFLRKLTGKPHRGNRRLPLWRPSFSPRRTAPITSAPMRRGLWSMVSRC